MCTSVKHLKLLILEINSFMLRDTRAISSMVERFVYTEEAVGSIPTSPTFISDVSHETLGGLRGAACQ